MSSRACCKCTIAIASAERSTAREPASYNFFHGALFMTGGDEVMCQQLGFAFGGGKREKEEKVTEGLIFNHLGFGALTH